MNRRFLISLALAGLLSAAAGATDVDSRVVIDDSGRVLISGLPDVLGTADVERHLTSGLTTSFLFRLSPLRTLSEGASRIDVRLELWDEVFLVSVIDGEGEVTRLEHASLGELRQWWANASVIVSGPARVGSSLPETARVSLDVIPFSQAELSDTRRWLAESMGGAAAGARPGASRAVSVLIATSMQRRAVRSWTWTVPLARGVPR